jgi:hypothetical protein
MQLVRIGRSRILCLVVSKLRDSVVIGELATGVQGKNDKGRTGRMSVNNSRGKKTVKLVATGMSRREKVFGDFWSPFKRSDCAPRRVVVVKEWKRLAEKEALNSWKRKSETGETGRTRGF